MKSDKWTFNITKKQKEPTIVGETVEVYTKFKENLEKETEMAKKEEAVATKTEETANKPNFTRWFLGTFMDPKTGEWMLGYVPFDSVTNTIGEIQTERCAGDKEIMLERYMIKQANLGILEAGNFAQERKTEIY